MTEATHAYIGVNADGRARAIVYDDPGEEESTASIVVGWRAMGRTVERLPIEDARQRCRRDYSA